MPAASCAASNTSTVLERVLRGIKDRVVLHLNPSNGNAVKDSDYLK